MSTIIYAAKGHVTVAVGIMTCVFLYAVAVCAIMRFRLAVCRGTAT